MPEVSFGDVRLDYVERGAGEPLVLVHGSASDRRTWGAQLDAFGDRFRTVAYSRRFHWPNEGVPAGRDYSMAEQADDLAAVLRTLGAAPAHLVGHSYGACLGLLLAAKEPDLVRSLVLAEPPAVTLFVSPTPKPGEILRLLLHRPRTALAIARFGAFGVGPASKAFRRGEREAAVRIFGNAVFGPGGYDRLTPGRKAQVHDNVTNVEAEILGSGFLPLPADTVRGVRTPTLLLTGDRSLPLFGLLADRIEELLPDCRRASIPGASHMVQEDNAPAFNAAVLAFLDAPPDPAAALSVESSEPSTSTGADP